MNQTPKLTEIKDLKDQHLFEPDSIDAFDQELKVKNFKMRLIFSTKGINKFRYSPLEMSHLRDFRKYGIKKLQANRYAEKWMETEFK